MDPSTKTLIKLTNGFSPEVPLARYDDMIRSVCAGADEGDREELEKFRGEISARREAGLKKRAELKEGVASDSELEPFLDAPDPRAPKEVLRFVISLPIGIVFLVAGLCCIYAVDPAYLEAHAALLYFGIGAAVLGALSLLVALFAFASYCKIRQYNNDLPRRNAEKRDEALAELDGQVAYEIMLAELLLKTLR